MKTLDTTTYFLAFLDSFWDLRTILLVARRSVRGFESCSNCRQRNLYRSVFFNIYELKVYGNQIGKLMAKKGKKRFFLCDVADNCLALMLFCCFTSASCPFFLSFHLADKIFFMYFLIKNKLKIDRGE